MSIIVVFHKTEPQYIIILTFLHPSLYLAGKPGFVTLRLNEYIALAQSAEIFHF